MVRNRTFSLDRQAWGILLLRVLVGWVFLSEGIQKLLFPATLGVGRFVKIGIPVPQFSAPFVGIVELVCGALVIVGLFTTWAAILLLIDIAVAISTTKIPMLVHSGFWAAMHEARTDFSMLLGLASILLLGSGRFSFDGRRAHPFRSTVTNKHGTGGASHSLDRHSGHLRKTMMTSCACERFPR